MDVLSDVLSLARLSSAIHFCPEWSAPWGVKMKAEADRAFFYVLSRGSCYLETEGMKSQLPLVGGDVVMLPQGAEHTLRDHPKSPAYPLEKLWQDGQPTKLMQKLQESDGNKTALVAGYFQFDTRAASLLLSSLPPLIHIRAERGESVPWLEATLKFLAAESVSAAPGAQTIMMHLTDVLFVQILRAHLAQMGKGSDSCQKQIGLLSALNDPQISKALALIHQRLGHPWTVAELGEQVSMSRTGFAVRFAQKVGIAPLDYVRKLRMQKAAELLRRGEGHLDEIAVGVGYESSVAFSKTFKREMGLPPGLYRKENHSVVA